MKKRHSRIQKKNFLKKTVFKKQYPEDRINRVTQERYSKTCELKNSFFYRKSFSQKNINKAYQWGNTGKI